MCKPNKHKWEHKFSIKEKAMMEEVDKEIDNGNFIIEDRDTERGAYKEFKVGRARQLYG